MLKNKKRDHILLGKIQALWSYKCWRWYIMLSGFLHGTYLHMCCLQRGCLISTSVNRTTNLSGPPFSLSPTVVSSGLALLVTSLQAHCRSSSTVRAASSMLNSPLHLLASLLQQFQRQMENWFLTPRQPWRLYQGEQNFKHPFWK